MAGVNDIITYGFGSYGSVNDLPTYGFGVSTAAFAPGVEWTVDNNSAHYNSHGYLFHLTLDDERLHLNSKGTD